MARFFKYQFAVSGTFVEIPETTQPNGSVSYQQGYSSNYTLPFGSNPNALPVDMPSFNGILYDITGALQQWQTQCVPDFITSSDNGGSPYPYPIFSLVRFDPGTGPQLYINTVANNVTTPTDPSWSIFTTGSGLALPAGSSLPFNGGVLPAGFLLEDGTVYNIINYPNLFAAIGNTFGGDGISTFAVPNSARRVLMGSGGTGTSVIGNAVGNSGGEEAHLQTIAEMPSHNHPPLTGTHFLVNELSSPGSAGPAGDVASDATTGNTGGGNPFNIIQPSRIVNWMIKY